MATWQQRTQEYKTANPNANYLDPLQTRKINRAVFPGGLFASRTQTGRGTYSNVKMGDILRQSTTGDYSPTAGGTAATPTTPAATGLSPQDIAAQKLALALRGQGMDWNYTQGQPYAPQASLVGGTTLRRIQNMPSLYQLMLQAAQASGIPPADYLAEIQQFQHAAPAYQQVSYGW